MLEMGIGKVLARLSKDGHSEIKYECRAVLRELSRGRATKLWHSLLTKLAL